MVDIKDENAGEVALVCFARKTKALLPLPSQKWLFSQSSFLKLGIIALSLQEDPIWTGDTILYICPILRLLS